MIESIEQLRWKWILLSIAVGVVMFLLANFGTHHGPVQSIGMGVGAVIAGGSALVAIIKGYDITSVRW